MSNKTEYKCRACNREPIGNERFFPVQLYSENRSSETAKNRYMCIDCLINWIGENKPLSDTKHGYTAKLIVDYDKPTNNAKAELQHLRISANGETDEQPHTRSIVKVCRALSRLHYTHQIKVNSVAIQLFNGRELWIRELKPVELKTAVFTDCTKTKKARIENNFIQVI